MKYITRKITGSIGTLLGVLLITAHITHAPVWILGFFGLGLSFNFASLWVQILGLLITVFSIVLLTKKLNTKYLLGIGVVAVVVLITLLVIGDKGMDMSGHNLTKEYSGTTLTKLPKHAIESVKPTEVVELKDGDTYDIEATIVSQEVGNRTVKRLAYNGRVPVPGNIF